VRSCWRLRRPASEAPTGWLDRLASDDPDAETCRRTIRREAQELGLSAAQAVGVLVYYLVEIAAQFRRRGMSPWSWEPLLLEVRRAADALNRGTSLEQVVLGRA